MVFAIFGAVVVSGCGARSQSVRRPASFDDILAQSRAKPDAVVSYGTAPQQFGQLWEPAGPQLHPVIVLIHGGCWQSSLPGLQLMEPMAQDLRAHGVAVWNIEYRRLGEPGGGYPGTFLDVGAAIDRLRSLAPKYHLDLSRIVLAGHSAGGQLALWAAARGKLTGSSPVYAASPVPIDKVVSLAGIDDLERYRSDGPQACGGPRVIDALVGGAGSVRQAPYADTSPAALIATRTAQIIVSGALDPIVPAIFGKAYAAKAKAAGASVFELTLPGAGHFELIDPTWSLWPRIRALMLQSPRN